METWSTRILCPGVDGNIASRRNYERNWQWYTPLLNGPTEFTSHAPVAVQFTTAPVKLCQTGDILFCVRGSTTGRMNWADKEYAIGRGLAAIRHREGNRYQPYLRGAIEQALPSLLAVSTGSTFPSVSRADIENLKV